MTTVHSLELEAPAMLIRSYQPGDEHAQARIYNAVAGSLPGFKPATAEEIGRRYAAAAPDPESRCYATLDGEVVGYAVFDSSGRVSYPWCLPDASDMREPLLEAVLDRMSRRSLPEAWAAYRADWSIVLDFLYQHGFVEKRRMINYVAEQSRLPSRGDLPADRVIEPLKREDLPRLIALAPELFRATGERALEQYFWRNSLYNFPTSLFGLRDVKSGALVGASVLVGDDRFADPTKIDAAMPCFRLGAFGTERQRHKRVNGLFSCVFAEDADGELLLSIRPSSQGSCSGIVHRAAQAPSDATTICRLYDRFFQHQGSFPILARRVAP
jgi:hypothetical protein